MRYAKHLSACSFLVLSSLYSSGPVWTTPQEIPAVALNILFPAFDSQLGSVVTTWIDASSNGFSSTFDGTNWGSPKPFPNNGTNTGLLFTAYDPSVGKLVGAWADGSGLGYSSQFDGNSWSPKQSIPGATSALIVFPNYDPGVGGLVATWSDFTNFNNSYSSIFDGTNWSATPQNLPPTDALLVFTAYSSAIGEIVGVWVNINTGNGFSSTFNGTNWSFPQQVATNMIAPDLTPTFNSVSTNGKLMVTWADATTTQGYFSLFDGANWSSPTAIPGVQAFSAVFPIVDPALDRVVVLWTDFNTQQGYFSLFDGINWSEPQIVPGATSEALLATYDPTIGKLVAVWRDLTTNQGLSSILYSPPIVFSGGGNSQKVAEYINFIGQSATMQPILASLNRLNSSQLKDALASISNARNAFLPYVAGNTAFSFSQAMEDHAAELRWIELKNISKNSSNFAHLTASLNPPEGKSQTAARETKKYALWLEGLGSFSHYKAQDQNPPFDANTGGVLLGVDYYAENVKLLGSLAYAHSHISEEHHAGNDNIDSYMALLFATGSIGKMYLEGGCSGIYNRYHSNRHIFFPGFDAHAKAKFSGWQAVPHFALGFDFCINNRWVLEPFVNADCAIILQDSFKEHGAAPLNAKQHSNLSELLQATGGMRTYLSGRPEWGIWFLQLTVAYQYTKGWHVGKIANASFVDQPTGFTVISLNNAQNSFVPGLEFFVRGNNGVFSSLNYTGQFSSQNCSNSVLGKIGIFF